MNVIQWVWISNMEMTQAVPSGVYSRSWCVLRHLSQFFEKNIILCINTLLHLARMKGQSREFGLRKESLKLPWWLSGKEPACQCRRHRFDLWSRKIPHAREQPSLCTTIEPKLRSLGTTAAAAAKSLQSCPTLCDPTDGSPPGSPVPGILQARTLEWVAISFSNAWKGKVKVKSLSLIRLLATPWIAAYQAPPSMGFSTPLFHLFSVRENPSQQQRPGRAKW